MSLFIGQNALSSLREHLFDHGERVSPIDGSERLSLFTDPTFDRPEQLKFQPTGKEWP